MKVIGIDAWSSTNRHNIMSTENRSACIHQTDLGTYIASYSKHEPTVDKYVYRSTMLIGITLHSYM